MLLPASESILSKWNHSGAIKSEVSMKSKILLLFGLILAGCVPSWNALYTEKDIVFDRALVGVWNSPSAKETWEFTKAGEKLYQLQHTDKAGRKAGFEVRLVQLKDRRFLDLYLTKVEGDVNLNDWAGFSLTPAHLILKVEQIEPRLKVATMNPTWMKQFVTEHPDAIAHRIVFSGDVVLTASTRDLQKFILKHADDQDFFGGIIELTRSAPGERETTSARVYRNRLPVSSGT